MRASQPALRMGWFFRLQPFHKIQRIFIEKRTVRNRLVEYKRILIKKAFARCKRFFSRKGADSKISDYYNTENYTVNTEGSEAVTLYEIHKEFDSDK